MRRKIVYMGWLVLFLFWSRAEGLVTRRTALLQSASLASLTQVLPRGESNVQQPLLSLSNGNQIPAVGYSFYKTPSDVERCTQLALDAGVRLFDTATDYGINPELGSSLKQTRRNSIYISHKVSNFEQATESKLVKKSVKNELKKLRIKYLDVGLIHSPLTDQERRLSTYAALIELQKEGAIKNVGVCHYGIKALDEIVNNGFQAPQIIQLQLSPFNQHKDILRWAQDHGSVLQCAAWSRLSSVDGPQDQWIVVGDIAKQKQKTKAQILVRWALQKGYGCVPRSSAATKVERQAIYENSYSGVSDFSLSDHDMKTLDNLDIGLPAGQIKVTDGYTMDDVVSNTWDPTQLAA